MRKAKPSPYDVACPRCGAQPGGGCFVMGFDTIMKGKPNPHKARVLEAEKKGAR